MVYQKKKKKKKKKQTASFRVISKGLTVCVKVKWNKHFFSQDYNVFRIVYDMYYS